jgi:hypothetical protein
LIAPPQVLHVSNFKDLSYESIRYFCKVPSFWKKGTLHFCKVPSFCKKPAYVPLLQDY